MSKLGLEESTYKQTVRAITLDHGDLCVKGIKNPKIVTLPAVKAKFEQMFSFLRPNTLILGIDDDPKKVDDAQKWGLPKNCMMYGGEFHLRLMRLMKTTRVHYAWADRCKPPTMETLKETIQEIRGLLKGFSITYNMNCRPYLAIDRAGELTRHAESYGSHVVNGEYCFRDCHQSFYDKKNDPKQSDSFFLIQAVVKFIAAFTGYKPSSIVFYPGGDERKVEAFVPMVTVNYKFDKNHKITARDWNPKIPFGFDGVPFANLFNVKHGKSTMKEELGSLALDNRVQKAMKFLKNQEAGKKAARKRKENERVRENAKWLINVYQERLDKAPARLEKLNAELNRRLKVLREAKSKCEANPTPIYKRWVTTRTKEVQKIEQEIASIDVGFWVSRKEDYEKLLKAA